MMQYYQIKEISQMTSLSIRTLQYYDDIGLVKPSCRSESNYRCYSEKGKPVVGTAQITYDCHSPNLIESKSLKLYFNSLNNHKFESLEQVTETVRQDLEAHIKATVYVDIKLIPIQQDVIIQTQLPGINIDELDVACDTYQVVPEYLSTSDQIVEETINSNLLKSNCLVTEQPDWGSLLIKYRGRKINHEGLLKYIVSFRNHNEFHEQCIERIFTDIMRLCQSESLTVYGRYTRRGGLDINPYRSTNKSIDNIFDVRLLRQ